MHVELIHWYPDTSQRCVDPAAAQPSGHEVFITDVSPSYSHSLFEHLQTSALTGSHKSSIPLKQAAHLSLFCSLSSWFYWSFHTDVFRSYFFVVILGISYELFYWLSCKWQDLAIKKKTKPQTENQKKNPQPTKLSKNFHVSWYRISI